MESPPAKAAQAQTSNASVEPSSTQTAMPAPPDKPSGRAISKKNVGAGTQPDHVMQVTRGDSTTETCVGNQNSLTPVSDEDCKNCMNGQSYWPCSDQDLCWCWDTTKPKKPPAPISGYPVNNNVDPCALFTKDMFDVHDTDGDCCFLGNTAHESDDFEAGREYLACGDRKKSMTKCIASLPGFEPPEGCICDIITQVEETGPLAGASFALTGEADTFCNDPEQVVLNPMYAWGTAIFFWMESQKEGTTCHKEALNRDFGGTLNLSAWLEKLSSFGGCKGLTDSFEECLGDGWCPYCDQYGGSPTEESGFSPVEIVPSTKAPTISPILDSGTPTLKPSSRPTNEPSASPVTTSPTEVPTESAWGYCGDGEGYCNDSAIWSPTCPTVTAPPSPPSQMMDVSVAPTNSPIGSSTLNDVFGISDETDTEEESPLLPQTPQPTNTPTGSKTSTPLGPKPTGGKKPVGGKQPVGGKPKPAVKTSIKKPTPLPTSLPTVESPPTQRPSKEPIFDKELSYPENTFFCGNTWQDVNDSCSIRCPSSKSEDCPEDMSCFAFTECNDKLTKDDATDSINSQSDDSGGATALDITFAPAQETSLPEGCTGNPCPFENECRSQYGFCGSSFIYCNSLSSWKLEECGLLGIDASGETHLCDVELFECSNGKAVHRNPEEGCEYFQCPTLEESAVFPSIFNVPGPSPLPPLPKPTLTTITKPTSQSSSAVLPIVTISTSASESDSSNSLAVLLGDNNEDEVVDDTEQQKEDEKEGALDETKQTVSPNYDFGSFKADEWLFVNANSAHNRHDCARPLLVSLFTVQLLLLYN
ncbi:hypothetical protein QTG54_012031 [Skeletonema marinoi]|uniref:Uncharacterized protein n=1 Tax=Skeletonema marinoi TaxID=267567 RepID=A0AAD8Y0W8_9STRA|nr:hypothetical protein QTG54_012031 [Skeletonema marinoi]